MNGKTQNLNQSKMVSGILQLVLSVPKTPLIPAAAMLGWFKVVVFLRDHMQLEMNDSHVEGSYLVINSVCPF